MRIMSLAAMMIGGLMNAPAFAGYGLADGGFDSQGANTTNYCYFQLNNCTTGPWSGTGAGFIHSGSSDWGGPVAVSPSSMGFIQTQGSLSQTFTASASGTVRLVWFDQERQNAGGTQTYIVQVNGSTIGTFSASTATFQRRYSAPFALTANSAYTISFIGQTTADNTAFIDSVDILPASEAISYSYDALGRLTSVGHAGAVTNGQTSTYQFDPADNRTNVTVIGAPQ